MQGGNRLSFIDQTETAGTASATAPLLRSIYPRLHLAAALPVVEQKPVPALFGKSMDAFHESSAIGVSQPADASDGEAIDLEDIVIDQYDSQDEGKPVRRNNQMKDNL